MMKREMMNSMIDRLRCIAAVAAIAGVALLASCGGGASSTTGGGSPTVSTLSASTLSYGRTMVVSVNGQSLDQGITMETDSVCTAITQIAGGTDASVGFSCRVGTVGEYNITIRNSGGKFLASLKVNVPLPQVTLVTSLGTLILELDLRAAPVTVDNFLRYVTDSPSFYRNVIFHNVVAADVIRAGGYGTGLVARTSVHAPIALESQNGLKNLRGSIGMARDPAVADSATSQFYVNLKDAPERDYQSAAQPGLAVFGSVVKGMDVADAIGAVPTRFDLTAGLGNVPVTEVLITSALQTR